MRSFGDDMVFAFPVRWNITAVAIHQAVIAGNRPSLPSCHAVCFNLGYRGFQQSYRTCTPAANLVIRRYVQEGTKIARDITARYAN